MNSPAANGSVTSVPLVAVDRQYLAQRDAFLAAWDRLARQGRFVMGAECEQFERDLAHYCGSKHAVGCASGSDALLLALMAFGIGPGDEVICPSYTFFATASAVTRVGAKPVFIDIEPRGYNLDVAQLPGLITERTKAIIPVHLYGQCADMDGVLAIARSRGLAIIEDAAQAIGATWHEQPAGSLGDIGCLSFYPTKNLGAFGDAGALLTQRDELDAALRMMRLHGEKSRYHHQVVGINSRLDAMQAAVLNIKLPQLDSWAELRRQRAARYDEQLAACGLDQILTLPCELPDRRHVWNQYIVRVPDGKRDALREHLSSRQIATQIYYPVPLHLQRCFAFLGYGAGDLPESERAAAETMALPIFPELTADEQDYVVREIAGFFGVSPMRDHALRGPKFLERWSRVTPGASAARSEIRSAG